MPKKPTLSKEQVAARGRELAASEWKLPKRYRLQASLLALPPEELKKKDPEMYDLWENAKQEQERLAARFASPHARLSSQEIFRARSVQRAEEVRNDIERLNHQIAETLVTGGDGNIAELQAAKVALKHKRAEYLATHGRYDLAFEEEPDPQYREHYLAILDAVYREDDEWCKCGPHRGSGEHANITVSQQHVAEEVYSLKHAKVMPLLRCGGCGTLNVAALPDHIRELRSHRSKALQIAGHLNPDEAAKKLVSIGHTSAKLLK